MITEPYVNLYRASWNGIDVVAPSRLEAMLTMFKIMRQS